MTYLLFICFYSGATLVRQSIGTMDIPLVGSSHTFIPLHATNEGQNQENFVLGVESYIKLKVIYYLVGHTLKIQNRSILLYPLKDMNIPLGIFSTIPLHGTFPIPFPVVRPLFEFYM